MKKVYTLTTEEASQILSNYVLSREGIDTPKNLRQTTCSIQVNRKGRDGIASIDVILETTR